MRNVGGYRTHRDQSAAGMVLHRGLERVSGQSGETKVPAKSVGRVSMT
jgi:hypothetical protein